MEFNPQGFQSNASTSVINEAVDVYSSRKILGYSQAKLARTIGVSTNSVGNWERNKFKPIKPHRTLINRLVNGWPVEPRRKPKRALHGSRKRMMYARQAARQVLQDELLKCVGTLVENNVTSSSLTSQEVLECLNKIMQRLDAIEEKLNAKP